jgi:phosphatidate cytidylyltransferase
LSDAGQYLVGKLFGRHRLAPRLSPGKTWEGLLGGWAVACAVGTALHPVWGLDPFRAALFSAVACVCGFFGGLCFSAIKRRVGLKDWGSWLKGHGGMLDRVDSLVLSAPACWALLMAGA